MIGRTLAHYQLLEQIGAGGMGEVYRARDTHLDRDVAIKVLPEGFAADSERLARFEREARLLAALNHPNVATVHDLEESDGVRFIAMEVVEGETLAEHLRRGPLPVDLALKIASHIAQGLEAAHDKGIIHRDLKPANVMLTSDVMVKVLDFGLAKVFEADVPIADLSDSPTIDAATQAGLILGTAAYMSPEQARGRPLDKRTDIWSFGCVLYEMLTGSEAFQGADVSETLASILRDEPDWTLLPDATPVAAQRLIRHCLHKELRGRTRDIGDAVVEIVDLLERPSLALSDAGPGLGTATARNVPWWRRALPWAVAAATTLIAVYGLSNGGSTPAQPTSRIAVALPAGVRVPTGGASSVAISRDGRNVVFRAVYGGDRPLYLRPIDRVAPVPIIGTEGAMGPFFSPDGEQVGFSRNGQLWRIPLTGGSAIPICQASVVFGATWGEDGRIVFAPGPFSALMSVPAAGGVPQPQTQLDAERGDRSHRWPHFLPGGSAIVYNVWSGGRFDESAIAITSIADGDTSILFERGADPSFATTGHLLYGRGRSLLALPFDPLAARATGPAVSVLEDLHVNGLLSGAAHFAVSEGGTLVYRRAPPRDLELLLVSRNGAEEILGVSPGPYAAPRFSPDGLSLAYDDGSDVWVYDLGRHTPDKITPHLSDEVSALWGRDGRHLGFGSNRTGLLDLFWRPLEGSGPAGVLHSGAGFSFADTWSPGGDVLLYTEQSPTAGDWNIWAHSMSDGRDSPVLQTTWREAQPAYSPDGEWVAYSSNELGSTEVYIRPSDGNGRSLRVSASGGRGPVWGPSGRELFYRRGAGVMRVPVNGDEIGEAELLLDGNYHRAPSYRPRYYDVSPDGTRFAMLRSREGPATSPLIFVFSWFHELKQRAPTDR